MRPTRTPYRHRRPLALRRCITCGAKKPCYLFFVNPDPAERRTCKSCLRNRREHRAQRATRRRWQTREADARYRVRQQVKRAATLAAALGLDPATLDLAGARGLDAAAAALRARGSDFDAAVNALRERLDLDGVLAADAAVPAPRPKRSFLARRQFAPRPISAWMSRASTPRRPRLCGPARIPKSPPVTPYR
jgi:hypothetical protein